MAIPAVLAAAARAVVSAAAKAAIKVAKKATAKKTAEKVAKKATAKKTAEKVTKTTTKKLFQAGSLKQSAKSAIRKTIENIERAGIANTPETVRTVRENQFLLEESYTFSVTRDIWSSAPLKYRSDAIVNAFKDKQLKDGSPIQTVQDVTEYLRENDPNFPQTRNVNALNADIVQSQIEEYDYIKSDEREFANNSVDWNNVAQFNQRANKVWAGFQRAMNNANA